MIKLYNTLTRKIEEFKPIKPSEVGIYSCGPTVSDYPHIGDLRAYVFVSTKIFPFFKNFLRFTINHLSTGKRRIFLF